MPSDFDLPRGSGRDNDRRVPVRVPGKKQTLLAYLQRGVAMVHLDARRAGVTVPPQFAADAHLRLNLSYRYAIPDFDVSDERIRATLSFGGRPFQCVLPWDAVFGITSHSGDGQVWPEDLPVEVMQSMAEREEHAPSQATPASPMTPVALSAVPGNAEKPASAPAQEQKETPSQPRHLRLVR